MRFGDYELDLSRFELRRAGMRVRVQPKVLDLLVYLIRHRERVVPKEELFDALWQGVHVAETALTQTVKEARRAVRDDGNRQRIIQTVRGRGYRFVAPVEEASDPEARAVEEPFVGRASALAVLSQEFAAARGGRGRTVLLTGEPGIGKSRTAAAFAGVARREGARVLVGRCVEGQGAPPHWPWTQVVRGALRQGFVDRERELRSETQAVLVRALPGLREELGDLAGEADVPLPDEQARFRLSEALSGFLAVLASRSPLVLILDDLHWADQSSLHLLEYLVQQLGESRILLVCTYRDTELARDPARARLLAAVARAEGAHGVTLEGLSSGDVAELIEVTTGKPAPMPVAESLRDRTGGNPFFLTQVLQLWQAGEGQAGELPGDVSLPHGVREAIGRHLDSLAEASRDLLSRAAVIGREFELDVLAHVSGVSVDAALETLESAIEARVVRPVRDSWTRFEFAHALIPETLYEAMTAARRLRLHGRVGGALEALRGDDPGRVAEIAHHLIQAAPMGHAEHAVDYGRQAAEFATHQLAYEEAVFHYEQAVETLRFHEPDATLRLELLLSLAEAQSRVGQTAQARQTFQQASTVARERGDANALARAALGLDWNIVRLGQVGTDPLRLALLGEALGAVGPRETPLRVRLMAALDEALYFEEEAQPEPSLSREAVEMARRLEDPDALAFALNRRHMVLRNPDRLDDRLAVSTELARLAKRRRDPDLIFDAHGSQIHDALERGDIRLVDEALDTFQRLAQEHKLPKYLWYSHLYRAMRDLLAGRYSEAESHIEHAYSIGARVEPDLARLWHVAQMQALRIDLGKAGDFLPELREVALLYPIPAMQLNLALCEALTGTLGPARRILDQLALEGVQGVRRDISWVLSMSVLAQLCSLLGHAEAAARVYEQLLHFPQQHIVVGTAIVYRGSVATELGKLATVLKRFDDAASHFDTALEREQRMGTLPYVAWVQCTHAGMLLERGDVEGRREARERLREAAAIAEAIGARFHQERVSQLQALCRS